MSGVLSTSGECIVDEIYGDKRPVCCSKCAGLLWKMSLHIIKATIAEARKQRVS
jgi:hypothetical protein